MDIATQTLIIILSVTLSIFLIVGIVLGIYLIKLTKDINKLTRSAERTASMVESAIAGVAKYKASVFATDALIRYINKFKKSKKGKNNEQE